MGETCGMPRRLSRASVVVSSFLDHGFFQRHASPLLMRWRKAITIRRVEIYEAARG